MTTTSRQEPPPISVGFASFILATIGVLLFFLPILGIPVSALAILAAIAGLCTASGSRVSLRWSVAGLAASILALSIDLAIWFAPNGYIAPPRVSDVPSNERRSDVPPPAREPF